MTTGVSKSTSISSSITNDILYGTGFSLMNIVSWSRDMLLLLYLQSPWGPVTRSRHQVYHWSRYLWTSMTSAVHSHTGSLALTFFLGKYKPYLAALGIGVSICSTSAATVQLGSSDRLLRVWSGCCSTMSIVFSLSSSTYTVHTTEQYTYHITLKFELGFLVKPTSWLAWPRWWYKQSYWHSSRHSTEQCG